MRELLDSFDKKYFINLGDNKFSPIMKITSGIALQYCNLINNNKLPKKPLFLCFPEKKKASLWTAISILTNFFYEDFIDNEVDGIKLKKGDKIKIFDCIAEIEKVIEDKVYLKFKDQGGIPIKKSLRSQISKVPSQRTLSLWKKYTKNLKDSKTKRNSISKILEPNESVSINQNNLDSKVLLVSGRGNTSTFIDLLNKIKIYDEPLSKIFPLKKNLIVSPDLKSYVSIFNSDKEKQFNEFKEFLLELAEIIQIEEAKLKIEELIKLLLDEQKISQEFDSDFNAFILEFEGEIIQLKFLEKKYPGIQDELPIKLRAVIINDISQIYEYEDTIEGFLEKGVPVIFISNRIVENTDEIDFYKRLFSNNPEYFRINWNKNKIGKLIQYSSDINYIDDELWLQCKRYAKQRIEINITSKNELDILTPRLLKLVKELDNFETLQKAFYSYFYPSLYALKNSMRSTEQITDLILEFKEVFDAVKNNGITQDVAREIEKGIQLASEFKENTKSYNPNSNIFSNVLTTSALKKNYIPLERIKVNVPTSSSESIVFTGYPYNEYSGKYLLNSVCLDFVPDVKIICWPNEASLTTGYLKRRITASYFSDNIAEITPLKDEYLLKTEMNFEDEINSFLTVDNSIQVENVQEANLEYLHTFKYKGYGIPNHEENSFTVKCDIINFDDGSFMFLPKQSTVLTQTENNIEKTTICETRFNDLNIGYKIFKYRKDRAANREISKNDLNIKSCFEKLESWKVELEKLFTTSNKNLDTLEQLFFATKKEYQLMDGNPIKSSIQRWLYDDEFICPRTQNLKIILLTAKVENFDQKLNELENAFREVNSYTISLSSNIKKNIINQLTSKNLTNDKFSVNIHGNEIKVETRTISSLIKNEIEIDYHNTRKILC